MNVKSGKAPHRRGRIIKDDMVVAGKHGGQNEHRPSSNGNRGSTSSSAGSSTNIPKFHAPLIQWASDEASTWYEYGNHLPDRNETIASLSTSASSASVGTSMARRTTPDTVRRYRSMADAIYQNELRLFNHTKGQGKSSSLSAAASSSSSSSSSSSNTDDRWVENTMKKGTVKDRIAAMSVTLSTDPIHKLYALDGLLSMVGCSPDGNSSGGSGGGRPNSRVAQLTAEALEDLFVNTLLPADRKLVTLAQRPLYLFDDANRKRTMSPRILLLWRFEELIKEKYDLYLRQYMARTLEDGAEMQKKATLQSAATLLSSVPEGEAKLLSMMVNKLGDPDKKVAAAAGHQLRLVLEQHSNMQTVVAREVQQLAHRPHLSPKALYNCIIFLNQLHLKRASTEEKSSSSLPASLVKTYFRLFEVAVKKPKMTAKNRSSEQEDAGSMKGRLLSALLTGVNRAHPYLPEKDQDMEEHVDALYRIVHTASPAACTQALLLLFHLAVGSKLENEEGGELQHHHDGDKDTIDSESSSRQKQEDQRRERFYRALYATMSKANQLSNGKHLTMYFNVLYKAMKYDVDQNRVLAFAKRLLAGIMHGPAPSTAASLYLLQEISKTHEKLQSAWGDVTDPEINAWVVLDESKREPKAALVDMRKGGKEVPGEGNERAQVLIPPMWEISALAQHFHPSVARFANDIGEIDFEGDPLTDFGLSSFLDKFAYKNPKSRDKLMQQRPKTGAAFNRRTNKLQGRLALPLNDPGFLNQTKVNEQEEFFHRFFVEQARRDEMKGIARHSMKEDSDDASDEENEAALDAAQERALDAAEEVEEVDTGVKSFEEYEAQWETDEEEEMFVDSLAMKMLETEAEGPANIDDDLDDADNWDELYKDDENDTEKHNAEEYKSSDDDSANIDIDAKGTEADLVDADADFAASDDESASSDGEPEVDENDIVGGLEVDRLSNDCEDEDLADLELLEDSDQSDDDTSDDDSTGGGTKKDLPLFASAEEYEELIEKSFQELKRRAPASQEEESGGSVPRKKPSSIRKKRRKG